MSNLQYLYAKITSYIIYISLALLTGCIHTPPKVIYKPYPVLVEVPCTQTTLPAEPVLMTKQLPEDLTWIQAVDALISDVLVLEGENEALRKELEACGKPVMGVSEELRSIHIDDPLFGTTVPTGPPPS